MKLNSKLLSSLMTIAIILLSVQTPHAHGTMIETASILDAQQIQQTRAHLKQFLANKVVQNRLEAWGISSNDAAAYIESLTDAEIRHVEAQIKDLPAGGSGGPWGVVGIALVVTFIILLITDLLGYTDLFNIR